MLQPNILIVDSTEAGKVIRRTLNGEGYLSLLAKTNQSAIALMDSHLDSIECVIVDLRLAHNSAFEFLYEMRSYQDMLNSRVLVYSSVNIPKTVRSSLDWRLLDIERVYYKSTHSVRDVCAYVATRIPKAI